MAFDDKPEDFTPGAVSAPASGSALSAEFADGLPKGTAPVRSDTAAVALVDGAPTGATDIVIPATFPASGGSSDAQVAQAAPRVAPGDASVTVVPKTACPAPPSAQLYLRFINDANDYFYAPRTLPIEAIREKYNCQIKNDADAARFAKTEIAKIGDPFTKVKLPSDVVNGQPSTTGLDARFEYEPGLLANGMKVQAVAAGSAAAQGGMQAGDRVLKVNGVDLTTREFDAATLALQGPTGNKAQLEVMRAGKVITLDVPRATSDLSVSDRMLDPNTAYIRISNFGDERLSNQLFDALFRRNSARALILDLRGNPGGLVPEVLEVASMFIKDGTILRTRERIPGKDEYKVVEYKLDAKNLTEISALPGKPPAVSKTELRQPYMAAGKQIVVLTDHGTASAAEIFSGALQDVGAAMVVGTPTFGKGIGQVWFRNLPGGTELLVTNFKYETPKGRWPGDGSGRGGLKPDMVVEKGPAGTVHGSGDDVQLTAARMFIRQPTRVK